MSEFLQYFSSWYFAHLSVKIVDDLLCASELQGLDLSPYFLAVAQYKEKLKFSRNKPIKWVHANGEDTGLPSNAFDIVSISLVVCIRTYLLFIDCYSEIWLYFKVD